MRPESYQLFAQLCEGLITEDSSSLALIKQQPGGTEVIKQLHKTRGLAHNQEYRPIAKIAWSELKDNWGGAWVLIKGDKGTGAIRAERGSYAAYASNGGEVQSFRNDRGGNIIDFLKGIIGPLRMFYVGKDTGQVSQVKSKRQELAKVPSANEVSIDTLIHKFKPLWVKAMTAAQADIKGMAASMIKNDAFEKARRKLDLLDKIEQGFEHIESGSTPEFVGSSVKIAVYMAASHFYPQQTGNITRGYRGYSVDSNEGPRLLLRDIGAGDQKKLSAVLSFFKRNLISG